LGQCRKTPSDAACCENAERKMKQLFLSVILLVVLISTVPAGAQKKKTRGGTGGLNAAIIECWKQHGAAYDPVKKKWIRDIVHDRN
jgi:hypothetical protein